MQRFADTNVFYELLAELERRVGGRRRLGDCHGRMDWPTRGVYFFFEPGETRSSNANISRVVRVGTHALTAQSRTTLWKRLSQHRGTLTSRSGNHRASIFRLLLGQALMSRTPALAVESWDTRSAPSQEQRQAERHIEEQVSTYIHSMSLLVLPVLDSPGPESIRYVIERNSIALLSQFNEAAGDSPGHTWLGHYSNRERVRRSGLWNNNHVDDRYEPGFLNVFDEALRKGAKH